MADPVPGYPSGFLAEPDPGLRSVDHPLGHNPELRLAGLLRVLNREHRSVDLGQVRAERAPQVKRNRGPR